MNSTNFTDALAPLQLDSCGRPYEVYFTSDFGAWGWVTKISFPILFSVGLLGNSLGIIIAKDFKISSQRTYLLTIYILSLLYLIDELIVLIGTRIWDTELDDGNVYSPFFVWTGGVWLYIQDVLGISSQWILMLFCLDRCVAVLFPLYHFTRQQKVSAATAISIVFVCAGLDCLLQPATFYWYLLTYNFMENQLVQQGPPTALNWWKKVDIWFEAVFVLFVHVMLFICNAILLISLRRRNRRWSAESTDGLDLEWRPSNASSTSTFQKNISSRIPCGRFMTERTKTRFLFASSLFYLVTQSLRTAMPSLEIANHEPFCTVHLTTPFLIGYDAVATLLANIYFALGFVFLILVGPIERKKLCLLCPETAFRNRS